MKINVNGKDYSLDSLKDMDNNPDKSDQSEISVSYLLKKFDIEPGNVAVEKNKIIIPASKYDITMLANNDNIELVQFIGGG
jgi:sulfur carrier protein